LSREQAPERYCPNTSVVDPVVREKFRLRRLRFLGSNDSCLCTMAQGAVKKSKAAAPKKYVRYRTTSIMLGALLTSVPRPTQRVQRGARVIKPKKTSIITQNKIKHKSSSGLVGQTEKLLAQKAGHLEMLKGGKRDKKEAGKKEGGDKKKSG